MRKLVIASLCLILTLLVGYSGYRGYKVWKQHRMVALAKDYLAKSDARNAVLCLKQVLVSNPHHIEAARMMASFCESIHDPSAILWRSRVVEANPRSLDDRLALVRVALTMRDLHTATNAMEAVDAAGRKTPDYHQLAGAAETSLGNFDKAVAHFQEVVRLKPQDPAPQLNLSMLRLRSTNVAVAAEARAMLNVICLNPTNAMIRSMALRELVADALQAKKADTALSLSKQLVSQTNSVFSDRLLQLASLKMAQRPEFTSVLAECQKEAAAQPQKLHELATWQMNQMSPADALAWLKTLPPAVLTNQPAALLTAQCREAVKDWTGLESTLAKQDWGDMNFLRLALRARALRALQTTSAATLEWNQALSAATGQKQSLFILLRLAAQWGWASDTEDLLWRISNAFPEEIGITQTLIQRCMANGQTRALLTLFSKELQKNPSRVDAKNNVAMIALLLDAQEVNPHKLAREVYQAAPTNSTFVSTYALSLYLQKKSAEAQKVLETLKPGELEQPAIAGYYALILQASDKAKARRYFDLAAKAPYLPEERKLIDRARAGL